MESIYLLIPIALLLLALGITAFLWAVNNGQFDDLDREAYRILFDEDKTPPLNKTLAKTPIQKNKQTQ